MRKRFKYCDGCLKVVRIDEPECDHYFNPYRNAESTLVVFRGPDGKVSIPWSPDAQPPKGYVREEIKGITATRKLEKELDSKDYASYQRHQEARERLIGPAEAQRRVDLHQIIRDGVAVVPNGEGGSRTIHVSEFGRDIARAALARQKSEYHHNFESGNHRSE